MRYRGIDLCQAHWCAACAMTDEGKRAQLYKKLGIVVNDAASVVVEKAPVSCSPISEETVLDVIVDIDLDDLSEL